MTPIYFTLVIIAHAKDLMLQKKIRESVSTFHDSLMSKLDSGYDPSPWYLWKWCNFLFMTSFCWNVLITTIFWSLLYPSIKGSADYMDFFDHILPLILTLIDFLMNRIFWEHKQVLPNMAIVAFYGIINIIVTKATGEPLYPPYITWSDWQSWLIGFSMLPYFAFLWYCLYGLVWLKFKIIRTSILEEENMRGTVGGGTRDETLILDESGNTSNDPLFNSDSEDVRSKNFSGTLR